MVLPLFQLSFHYDYNFIKFYLFYFIVFLFYNLQINRYKITSLSRLSTIFPALATNVISCPCCSVVSISTMACLSLIAQADGFQHGAGEFYFKSLVLVDMRTGIYQLRRFESTDLLTHDVQHLQTCRAQSAQHGWHINSAGLPQCAVETALLTFVQDALLNAFEAGHPVPNSIVLWTKGHDMLMRFSALALQLAPLPLPLLVRNLEDLDCPPARCLTQLKPAEMPTTVPKALAFAKWLEDQHLA